MNARRNRIVDLSTRIYGWLLSAYPREHRRQYRAQMLQTFADLCRDTFRNRGAWGLLIIWAATVGDKASNAMAEHLSGRSVYMGMLKRWLAWKMNTEKFDPFWGGFFVGIVSSMSAMVGTLMLYFGNSGRIGAFVAYILLVNAVLSIVVQIIQKREYDKRIKTLTQ